MGSIVGKKKYFFTLSIVFVLVGIVFFFINGITMDVQFEGGTMIQIQTKNNNFTSSEAENLVNEVIDKKAVVQVLNTFDAENPGEFMTMLQIKIAKSEGVLSSDETDEIINALKADDRFVIPEDAEIQVQNIEPSIGTEVRNRGIIAVVISSILIIFYIWFRFRGVSGFSMGVCGVIALVHDAVAMVWVYIVFKLPFNESFIASVLTIVGYSINDTIIMFDRIRENLSLRKKGTISEIVDMSIKQTLTRSIFTTASTLFCIVVIYLFAAYFGINSVKEFSFPLIIGMISGTYSSICISCPLWAWWKERKELHRIKSQELKKA